MKRKHEDSPARSCDRNRKSSNKSLRSFGKAQNFPLKSSFHGPSKKPTNSIAVGLRRSSRKAAIERRIWAEPRKEKSWKLPKGKSAVTRRGRPPKKVCASKILLKNSCDEPSFDEKCKKSGTCINQLPVCENNVPVLLDSVPNGTHLSDNETALVIVDDNNEETLIIDDDIASLQGAVVDEIVKDYMHNVPNPIVDSHCKPNNLYELGSNSSPVSHIRSSCKLDEVNNSCATSEASNKDHLYIHSDESSECDLNVCVTEEQKYLLKTSTNPDVEHEREFQIDRVTSNSNDERQHEGINIDQEASRVEEEGKDDDNHVSLSEALAKLIELEDPSQGDELETVTIHPVTFSEETKSLYSAHVAYNNIPYNNNNTIPVHSLSMSCSSQSKPVTTASNHPERVEVMSRSKSSSLLSYSNDEIQTYCEEKTCANSELSPYEKRHARFDSESPFAKRTVSPFVKLTTKPLVIKTPLKCCECPMRFCTVRSLLWHFGTHEPIQKRRESAEIILENLFASWERPEIPIQLPKKTERHCKEFYCRSFSPIDDSKIKCENHNKEASSGNGVSRDFILKVPIPRLKRHGIINPDDDNGFDTKCTSLPFTNTSEISISPTPYVSILPRASFPPPATTPEATFSITFTPCPPAKSVQNDHKPSTNHFFSTTCPSTALVSPYKDSYSILSSAATASTCTTLSVTTKPVTSLKQSDTGAKSQVTVIPVEQLGQLRDRIRNGMAPDIFGNEDGEKMSHNSKSSESFCEENGLVVINRNLALRIISTSADRQGIESADSLSRGTSCLTILPQSKDDFGGSNGRHRNSPPTPDILTIVPQINPLKHMRKSSQTSPPPHLMTAVGKVIPDASQVVKLILIPPKKETSPTNGSHFHSDRRSLEEDWDSLDDSSEVESDEGGMVIDVKEEEGTTMDPLSLCTVTLEEEDNETKFNTFSQERKLSNVDEGNPIPYVPGSGAFNQSADVASKRPVPKLDEEKYLKRKYVCEFCQKRFGWSTDLKRHIILHTGERPFKCKWCPITFTRKFLLQNHMKKIHSQLCKWSDLWE